MVQTLRHIKEGYETACDGCDHQELAQAFSMVGCWHSNCLLLEWQNIAITNMLYDAAQVFKTNYMSL